VKVLLDTHTLLWAALAPEFLGRKAKRIISDEANSIIVSAASAWEIATKVRIGKLPGAEQLEREFLERMELAGYTLLPIDAATALRAGRFTGDHRDPFDRMIAAQALADDIPVLSKDPKLEAFGIRRIW
jgi:PIN domain nuclease of toxin-antitoxin system